MTTILSSAICRPSVSVRVRPCQSSALCPLSSALLFPSVPICVDLWLTLVSLDSL